MTENEKRLSEIKERYPKNIGAKTMRLSEADCRFLLKVIDAKDARYAELQRRNENIEIRSTASLAEIDLLRAELQAKLSEYEKYMNTCNEKCCGCQRLEAELKEAQENTESWIKQCRVWEDREKNHNMETTTLERQIEVLRKALEQIRNEAKNNKTEGGAVARAAVGIIERMAEEALKGAPASTKKMEAMLRVIEAARYLVNPSKHESPSEVCPECKTYGVGELREALEALGAQE